MQRATAADTATRTVSSDHPCLRRNHPPHTTLGRCRESIEINPPVAPEDVLATRRSSSHGHYLSAEKFPESRESCKSCGDERQFVTARARRLRQFPVRCCDEPLSSFVMRSPHGIRHSAMALQSQRLICRAGQMRKVAVRVDAGSRF
jgi:hypothetical protein